MQHDSRIKVAGSIGAADNYIKLGDKKSAIKVLDRMVDDFTKRNIPSGAIDLLFLAGRYDQADQRSKAVDLLGQAIETNKETSSDPKTSWWIAEGFAEVGEYEEAISILNEIDPQFLYQKSVGGVQIAETLIDAGETEKAIEMS